MVARRLALAAARSQPIRPALALPRLHFSLGRTLVGVGVVVGVLSLGYLAARSTSLFALHSVAVSGVGGAVEADVRAALRASRRRESRHCRYRHGRASALGSPFSTGRACRQGVPTRTPSCGGPGTPRGRSPFWTSSLGPLGERSGHPEHRVQHEQAVAADLARRRRGVRARGDARDSDGVEGASGHCLIACAGSLCRCGQREQQETVSSLRCRSGWRFAWAQRTIWTRSLPPLPRCCEVSLTPNWRSSTTWMSACPSGPSLVSTLKSMVEG